MKRFIALIAFSIFHIYLPAQVILKNGVSSLEDPILLGDGRFEDYKSSVSKPPRIIENRKPSEAELVLIEKARKLIKSSRIKTIALIDGDKLVWKGLTEPYLQHERFLSMSISKSILSIAAGITICKNNISLDTKSSDIIPELQGKDLGEAKLKHLLTMSSGTWEGNQDSSIYDQDQRLLLSTGNISHLQILTSNKVSTAEWNGLFSPKRQPGEVFAYRSTDPLVAALMLEKVNDKSYGEFIQDEILLPAGIESSAISGRDFFNNPRPDSVLRMKIDDWVRLTIWINEQIHSESCIGDYLKEATSSQVKNRIGSRFPQNFKSYGYFFGLENDLVKNSFWAVGLGGQRIGWSKNSNKMIISFSNSDQNIGELEQLFSDWINLQ